MILSLAQAREKAAILRGKIVAGESIEEDGSEDDKHRFKDVFAEAIEARREVAQWTNAKHTAQWSTTLWGGARNLDLKVQAL